eukprot:CAMPEP_0170470394 /NCGR_PEP_ID=MMETSP0123-20130129/12867_1 /TAXON_ID=182087 /ORGANISM="Favella ehrenbergii, Strain Fehren 1" /LENGTH=247 /DNA_ID=CAMNT_0010737505 /DNA_START=962 /DNA_END=1705 /DNA_ORIENTATION=+
MEHSTSYQTIERQTYSLLEWLLGDVGGLFDGLSLLAAKIAAPFATFAMNTKLMTLVYRTLVSDKSSEGGNLSSPSAAQQNESELEEVISSRQALLPRPSWLSCFLCCSRKRAKERKLLSKAAGGVSRQLDLVKFIRRQRLLTFASFATLNARQRHLLRQVSALPLRESSSDPETDSEEELQAQETAMLSHRASAVKFVNSASHVDKGLEAIAKVVDADRKRLRLALQLKRMNPLAKFASRRSSIPLT